MRRAVLIALAWTFFVVSAKAVREMVQLEEPEVAQRVEGVVVDPSGSPIPDMTVTDRTEHWGPILRSTKTDSKGHFHFSTQRGKNLYYLQFDTLLFNPLQLKIKLDKNAAQRMITARPEIGG
ncbi:MAG TPA: carboxypeptidase-like regulatory domain-containing protein [Terriglobales bacterium]|nr:carboxypeptidase-like regulatory domain-containing protein [Terriglobales bacterium]